MKWIEANSTTNRFMAGLHNWPAGTKLLSIARDMVIAEQQGNTRMKMLDGMVGTYQELCQNVGDELPDRERCLAWCKTHGEESAMIANILGEMSAGLKASNEELMKTFYDVNSVAMTRLSQHCISQMRMVNDWKERPETVQKNDFTWHNLDLIDAHLNTFKDERSLWAGLAVSWNASEKLCRNLGKEVV